MTVRVQVFVMCMTPALMHFQVNINIPLKNKRERSKSPAVAAGKNKPVVLPPPSAAAMAAGILPPGGAAANPFASQAPKLSVRHYILFLCLKKAPQMHSRKKKEQSRISSFSINAIDLIRNNQQKTSSLISIFSSLVSCLN